MRFAAICLLLGVGARACAGGLADAAAATSDRERLQGVWLSYWLLPGQELPPAPDGGGLLRISGNRVRPVERGQKSKDAPEEVSFTIDPRRTPKAIDVHCREHGKTVTWKGIYKLKGEEVRVAIAVKLPRPGDKSWGPAEERPASFDRKAAPKHTFVLVVVLKPAKDVPPAVTLDSLTAWLSQLSGPSRSVAYHGFGAVALSPDGKRLAASGAPGTAVRVWDTVTGKEMATLRGHDSEVLAVVFSRDGKWLFTAPAREVRVWEVATGKQVQRIPAGGVGGRDRLTLSGDEKWFVSGPETEPKMAPDGRFVPSTIRLWDVATGKAVRSFEITQTTSQLVGQYLGSFVTGKGGDVVVGAAVSPDGKWVAAGTEHGEVHLWDGGTGKKVCAFGGWLDVGAMPIGFSADGKRLVTFNLVLLGTKARCVVRTWDVATGKEKHAVEGARLGPNDLGRRRLDPSLTDDGRWLIWATGARATTVRIWDADTGKEVRAFSGHKEAITYGRASRDKKLLATYDQGGSVRLWDVATGKALRVVDVRPEPVRLWRAEDFQVRASQDLKVVVAWSPLRLTLWDLETGRAIRSMRR